MLIPKVNTTFNNNNNQINKNCSNGKSNNSNNNNTSNTPANPMFHPFSHGKLQAQNSGSNLNPGIQFHHQNNSAFQHSPQHSLIQSHLQHNNFHHPFHQGLISSLSSPIIPAGPIKNQILNNNNNNSTTGNTGNCAAATGLRNGLVASSIIQTAPGSITRSITPSSSSSANNFTMALSENLRNHIHHHEFQSANLETIKEDQNNHSSNGNDEADYDSGDEEPDSPYLQSNQRDTMEQAANFIGKLLLVFVKFFRELKFQVLC